MSLQQADQEQVEQPQVEQPQVEQAQEALGQAESSPSPPTLEAQPEPPPLDQSTSETSQAPETPAGDSAIETVPVANNPWPDADSWESISALDVETVPEAARAHFARIKDLHEAKVKEWDAERGKVDAALSELQEARAAFHNLIDSVDSSGDTKVVSQELEKYRGGFTSLASENIALAQRLFQQEHPDFDRYPEKIRQAWAAEMADDTFYSRYKGDTIYDKMNESWKFTVFRNKAEPAPKAAEPPAAPAQALRSEPVSAFSAQSLVVDGQRASSMPTLDPEDMSFEDILNQHDHLLKG